jgi:hypothetical protein
MWVEAEGRGRTDECHALGGSTCIGMIALHQKYTVLDCALLSQFQRATVWHTRLSASPQNLVTIFNIVSLAHRPLRLL